MFFGVCGLCVAPWQRLVGMEVNCTLLRSFLPSCLLFVGGVCFFFVWPTSFIEIMIIVKVGFFAKCCALVD